MTNREAFNIYYRTQVEKSIQSVENLPDMVFMLWQRDNPNSHCGTTISKELNWFWFTYRGREMGHGIDNIVNWLKSEFTEDISIEKQKWSQDDAADSWTDTITNKYNLKGYK